MRKLLLLLCYNPAEVDKKLSATSAIFDLVSWSQFV